MMRTSGTMSEDYEARSDFVLLRQRMDVTQKDIAEALNVSERTVWAWEKGRHEPRLTIPQTKALCRLLNVSIEDLPDDFGPVTRLP
jgi:DNA-binding XRE family transcriptional regulator